MENLSLNYKIIFCVILAITHPQEGNGEICEMSNQDEIAIKVHELETKMQTFEEMLTNFDNFTLHYQHHVTDVQEKNDDMRKIVYSTDQGLQELNNTLNRLGPMTEPFISKLYGNDCYWLSHYLYLGKKNRTQSGYTCQRWDSQVPHEHGNKHYRLYLDNSVKAAENYCRDPDATGYLWCYTTDRNRRWERCDIPACVPVKPTNQ